MTAENLELRKCSKCKCKKMLEHFDKNTNTGILKKLCRKCLEKDKEKNKRRTILKCPDCEYTVNHRNALNRHINSKHSLNPIIYKCKQCTSEFKDKGSLSRHFNSQHAIDPKIYKCEQCASEFKDKCSLSRHFNFKHSLNPYIYKCEYDGCTSEYKDKSNLNDHINIIHKKIINFECNECGYKCYREKDFNRHLNTCTGDENISGGEYRIREFLKSNNIEFKHDSTYEVRNDLTNRLLRWDFVVDIKECDKLIFIEFDGIQHFEPKTFGGRSKDKALQEFEMVKYRDEQKNKYCADNGHPLLRIRYDEICNVEEIVYTFLERHGWTCG